MAILAHSLAVHLNTYVTRCTDVGGLGVRTQKCTQLNDASCLKNIARLRFFQHTVKRNIPRGSTLHCGHVQTHINTRRALRKGASFIGKTCRLHLLCLLPVRLCCRFIFSSSCTFLWTRIQSWSRAVFIEASFLDFFHYCFPCFGKHGPECAPCSPTPLLCF